MVFNDSQVRVSERRWNKPTNMNTNTQSHSHSHTPPRRNGKQRKWNNLFIVYEYSNSAYTPIHHMNKYEIKFELRRPFPHYKACFFHLCFSVAALFFLFCILSVDFLCCCWFFFFCYCCILSDLYYITSFSFPFSMCAV